MKGINFPIFKTITEGVAQKFNLNDPDDRKKYFEAKAGPETEKLKNFFKDNAFIGFLLGKKNSGKGTYSKLFMETVGKEHVGHLSVGDMVRDVHRNLESDTAKENLLKFMRENYRGFHGIDDIENLIAGRGTASLISSELVLALLKYEISKRPRTALFLDGFPRAADQIGYAMFLKALVGYEGHPDFLIFIDVPESVIDERIKYRVICPQCNTPRNIRLALTKEIGYDSNTNSFFLICDDCGIRMVPKEGDELGIEPIRERLEVDDQISKQLLNLTGIPKIYLRNSVPVEGAKDFVEDYEITPRYEFEYDKSENKVKIIEKPWIIMDDNGVPSYSLLPSAVAIGLIKQTAQVLGL